jgi:hypothetical protein
MVLAELYACFAGWKSAHGAEESPAPPSDEEFERLIAGLD